MAPASQEVTQLLLAWRNGDETALDELIPLIYGELRKLAHRYMKLEKTGHTLQTTALVNEAYMKLAGKDDIEYQNRSHFFAVSAQVMRRLLVDHARSKRYAKRGGGAPHVSLDEAVVVSRQRSAEVLAIDGALEKLTAIDPRKGRIVELRYFGGLSVEETAGLLALSPITIKREMQKAKAWLYREINRSAPAPKRNH